jgi:hypothetical protein
MPCKQWQKDPIILESSSTIEVAYKSHKSSEETLKTLSIHISHERP